jgi:hypothetical protein
MRSCWTAKIFAFWILAAFVGLDTTQVVAELQVDWVQQFGTSGPEEGYGVTVDGLNNVAITGRTTGDLFGTNAGNSDVFVAKYSSTGSVLWTRQFGTQEEDWGCSVSADAAGNVYCGGHTCGNLAGQLTSQQDAFVAKYDSAGNQVWLQQFGMRTYNPCFSVVADTASNVYATGQNYDFTPTAGVSNDNAFLRKFSPSGSVLWTKQLDLAQSVGTDVTTDAIGNVFVAGEVSHSTVFVAKYDTSGNAVWTRSVANSTFCGGVASDGKGNVYVSGSGYHTNGYDAFLTKYDANGDLVWNRVFDSGMDDKSFGLAFDPAGDVYLTDIGDSSLFVVKYDADGNRIWAQQFGNSEDGSMAYGCAASDTDSVFITGYTTGNLAGQNAGGQDAFLAKVSAVPEPATLALLGMGGIGFAAYVWCRRRQAT